MPSITVRTADTQTHTHIYAEQHRLTLHVDEARDAARTEMERVLKD